VPDTIKVVLVNNWMMITMGVIWDRRMLIGEKRCPDVSSVNANESITANTNAAPEMAIAA